MAKDDTSDQCASYLQYANVRNVYDVYPTIMKDNL